MIGWRIVDEGEDGSLLIQSPNGSRRRVWNEGTARQTRLIVRYRTLLRKAIDRIENKITRATLREAADELNAETDDAPTVSR